MFILLVSVLLNHCVPNLYLKREFINFCLKGFPDFVFRFVLYGNHISKIKKNVNTPFNRNFSSLLKPTTNIQFSIQKMRILTFSYFLKINNRFQVKSVFTIIMYYVPNLNVQNLYVPNKLMYRIQTLYIYIHKYIY